MVFVFLGFNISNDIILLVIDIRDLLWSVVFLLKNDWLYVFVEYWDDLIYMKGFFFLFLNLDKLFKVFGLNVEN